MFAKRFGRKRREDPNRVPIPSRNGESGSETLSAYTSSNPPSRDPSPLRNSINSVDQQFAGLSNVWSHANRAAEAGNQDPLGLNVIHRPAGNRAVDIIFVHGLGGSSRLTWSKNYRLDFCWPLKFLPNEPDISEARILTFGYNVNFRPGSGKHKVSVLDIAKDLLYELKYAKDESVPELEDLRMGERPIIFIVHSMGGIIVKEAYMQGQNDASYEDIIKSVSSIIFLSTPHRGTNLAETLNRILQVSFVSNPMQCIAELATGSQTLQKLNEQFRHVAPKLQIVSFYETRPTTMFKKTQIMVLEKDSSVLGYPGEISKPLDADHHGICKYDSPNDPRYITVRNVLKTLVTKVKPKDKPPSVARRGAGMNIEEYLGVFTSPDEDYNFFRDRWTPGTCNWILSDESFIRWEDGIQREARVLWVHGNAAAGKSTLSTFVIDHLIHCGLPCHYFFIRFMEHKKRALSITLRSLACQLAHSSPEFADKLHQLEATGTDLKSADFRNIWQWLYKQSLFQLDIEYPLYLVIDGVDEADCPGSVIRLLSELHSVAIPLRVLVVSRKTHEISSAFQKVGRQVQLETINMETNQNDFLLYIDQELEVAGEDSYREEVVRQLLQRARGNFLWLHLAVQKINDCHTKVAVDEALKELPPAMEDLYDRMAASVQGNNNRNLGQSILGWIACAQRPLSVDEISDALGNDGLFDIHRTIGDLSGGFVIVKKDGKVSMIHETARRYLLRSDDRAQPFVIDRRTTNDKLFRRCIQRLVDPALRGQISRSQCPALLDYATNSWFIHFSLGSATDPDILEAVVKFLRGLHVITWINIAARKQKLRSLVAASRYLTSVALKLRRLDEDEVLTHRQAVDLIEDWATDLIKIVGKFGKSLIQNPDSIYKLIPPFCPEGSIIYQQFGRKESKTLCVSGLPSGTWDDCLARFSMEPEVMANVVLAAGNRIVILANIRKSSHVTIYNSSTFEEEHRITQPERVFNIQVSKLGDHLVTYGYTTTKVWDMASGDCIKAVKNPARRPRPQTLLFGEQDRSILVGSEDRCIRTFSLADDSVEWCTKVQIDEQSLEETILNFPICSALSPDGTMIAFGYRGHPATVWELEPPMLLGQCYLSLDAGDKTTQKRTYGEVFRLTWHPFSGEVFGLTQVGKLFKWDPYEEETSAKVQTGANRLTISCDGSLVATGDALGTIKIYTTADLSLLYQLSSQDPVINLVFSTDSRRLYDVRGSHGNVWEPNTLVRLADSAEYPDRNSDMLSETESLTKLSLHTEHHFARVDRVKAVSGQSAGPLYCYGTEGGVAVLCDIGRGKVCELERLTSYMSIEHLAFSDDGTLVAIMDLSGKLFVKRITRDSQDRDTWHVSHEFDLKVPTNQGHVTQLLFHPTDRQLVAPTAQVLYSVDLDSHDLVESTLPSGMSKTKWACHPTASEYLLGFETTKVHVFTWSDLREVGVYTYFPPLSVNPTTTSSAQQLSQDGSREADNGTPKRLLSKSESSHILLEISHSAVSGQPQKDYMVFAAADIPLNHNVDDADNSNSELQYTTLPAEVVSRIREPLSILPRRRLAFLDVDRWVCTWRFPPSTSRRSQGGASQPGSDRIEQYYFLPGDWVTADEAHLCTVMGDGTFICPRNGAAAAVQSAKLRQ